MATTYLLTNVLSDVGGAGNKQATLTRGAGLTVSTTNSALGPIGAASLQAQVSGVSQQWVTPPLKAVTIASTITYNFWVAESSASANATSEGAVVRLNNAGTFVSTISDKEFGTEMALTTRAAQNFTDAAPTSTTLAEGDRLGIILFYNDATATTMASGFTMTMGFAGVTNAADGDSFVQFTETVVEVLVPRPPFVVDTAVARASNY